MQTVTSRDLVDLFVSFLQRLVLLLIKFGNDGCDLGLVIQNDPAFLCQVIVLAQQTQAQITVPTNKKLYVICFSIIFSNKKLCYREEHSVSVVLRWCTL